jgi:hypothetical protein
MRLYHFLSLENAIDDIENKHIKISTIEDLNDPFELLAIELSDKTRRRVFLKIKKRLSQLLGVICFSRHWSNPLLWSHYAEKHRGVCLGFDVSSEVIIEIEYGAKRLVNDLVNGNTTIDEELQVRLLRTKYTDWAYEDEVRIFEPLEAHQNRSGLHFRIWGDDLVLREVVLGARCIDERARKIESVLKDFDEKIMLVHTRLAFQSFKIVENQLKRKARGD